MRPSIILALLFGCSFHLYAQAPSSRGTFIVGGSASYSRVSTDGSNNDTKQSTSSARPIALFCPIDNLALGVHFSSERTHASSEMVTALAFYDTKVSTISFGPVVRYYLNAGKTAFFPEVAYGRNFDDYQYKNVDQTFKSHGNSHVFSAGAGANYFISPAMALEVLGRYQRFGSADWEDGYSKNGLRFSLGLMLFLNHQK